RTGVSGIDALMGIFTTDSAVRISDIKDGTSNTIAFGEYVSDYPPGRPGFAMSWMGAGYFDSINGLPDPSQFYSFGSRHGHIVNFAFGDGSVRSIRKFGGSQNADFIYATAYYDGQIINWGNLGQ